MTQQRRAKLAFDARITPGLRGDVWAAAAIGDRAAGSYLRGYVVAAFLVGTLTYIGLVASSRLGGPQFQEPLALATLAGATQVVPIVGPILGAAPALLLLAIDPAGPRRTSRSTSGPGSSALASWGRGSWSAGWASTPRSSSQAS